MAPFSKDDSTLRLDSMTSWALALTTSALLSAAGCSDSDSSAQPSPEGSGGSGPGPSDEPNSGGAGGADLGTPIPVVSDTETVGAFPRCSFEQGASDAALLDDFESGLLTGGQSNPARWVSRNDGSGGEFIWETVEDDDNSHLRVTASGFDIWAGFTLNFGSALGAGASCALDANPFVGVRFRAKGEGALRLRASTADTLPSFEGGTCTEGDACYDHPGAWIHLTPDWKMVEIPFCGLRMEGWGGRSEPIDPSQLVALGFFIQSFAQRGDFLLEIDDIELYSETASDIEQGCDIGCPARSVPNPSNVASPELTYLDVSGNLSLHTFEQETTSCGPLTRRYLAYVPDQLEEQTDTPVLIGLHGYGANGESFRDIQTRGSFERLADEEGFVVVYGSAAPSAGSSADPLATNTGTWRQAENDDFEVDDVDYLRRVLADLHERNVISGDNLIYLTGLSNGGGMTLRAASEAPEMFTGIAPFMPFVGTMVPPPSPPSMDTSLRRLLLVHSVGDPGLPPNHDEILPELPSIWAQALGIPDDAIENPTVTPLDDLVVEGEGDENLSDIAQATADSTASRTDYFPSDGDVRVSAVAITRGGHFWPHPIQDDAQWIRERWGLRNQDFDGAEMVWEFFMSQ